MGFWSRGSSQKKETIDFDAAARDLFAQLNLRPGDVNRQTSYNPVDAIYKHPRTNAKIYIGNAQAAQSETILAQHGISRVVNCTDNMPNFLEGRPGFKYLRFDVSNWGRYIGSGDNSVRAFTDPLFKFVTESLEGGHSVMVHCLAGAHRAGTTGCACLMHFCNMDARSAIRAAKKCRPVVDPIGMLPEFLMRLESMHKAYPPPAPIQAGATSVTA